MDKLMERWRWWRTIALVEPGLSQLGVSLLELREACRHSCRHVDNLVRVGGDGEQAAAAHAGLVATIERRDQAVGRMIPIRRVGKLRALR